MNRTRKLGNSLKSIDAFEQPVIVHFGSIFGGCLTLLIWVIVAAYGIKKYMIMHNHGDTMFNEYQVRNELPPEKLSQEDLGFFIAFSAFNYVYDVETESDVQTNGGFENYIDYKVGLWTQKKNDRGYKYVLDEVLSTHRCTDDDKKYLSQNYDYIESEEIDKIWYNYTCLENPERVSLRQGSEPSDRQVLFIEAYFCKEKDNCMPFPDIQTWAKKQKDLVFLSNSRAY